MAFVAALYSVVLPAGARLRMADLKDMAADLGLSGIQTVGSTGNLLFRSRVHHPGELEASLEAGFGKRFGKTIPIIVRPAKAFRRLPAANPFSADHDPRLVAVRLMREGYRQDFVEGIRRYIDDEDVVVADGDLWIAFKRDPGTSRLLSAFSTKAFATPGTFRTLGMVTRINAALDGMA